MTEAQQELVERLATRVCEREFCILYDVQYSGKGNGSTLRVFIDGIGTAGVAVDQCAKVSNGLSLLLDVEDLFEGTYQLEVSSPGLERHLSKDWHFKKVVGKRVKVSSKEYLPWPQEHLDKNKGKKFKGLKLLEGELLEASNDGIKVLSNDYEWEVSYGLVHKASLVFEMNSKKMR